MNGPDDEQVVALIAGHRVVAAAAVDPVVAAATRRVSGPRPPTRLSVPSPPRIVVGTVSVKVPELSCTSTWSLPAPASKNRRDARSRQRPDGDGRRKDHHLPRIAADEAHRDESLAASPITRAPDPTRWAVTAASAGVAPASAKAPAMTRPATARTSNLGKACASASVPGRVSGLATAPSSPPGCADRSRARVRRRLRGRLLRAAIRRAFCDQH